MIESVSWANSFVEEGHRSCPGLGRMRQQGGGVVIGLQAVAGYISVIARLQSLQVIAFSMSLSI